MMKFGKRKTLLFAVLLAVFAFASVGNASGISQDVEWNRTYEENPYFNVETVKQTSDGGYIIAGGDGLDVRLVKTDPTGIMQWNTTIKSTCNGWGFSHSISIRQTLDGGYILSYERLCDGLCCDFKIIKLDPNGNEQWNRSFYRSNTFFQTSDGSTVIAGRIGENESDHRQNFDVRLMKLDPSGKVQFKVKDTYSGEADSLTQTSDGGYAITGAGKRHLWIVKTDSNGNRKWKKSYEQYKNSGVYSIQQTLDNGYILAGKSTTSSDVWIMKTDPNGNEQWSKTYEGIDYELLRQTADGSYILYTRNLIIKIDTRGNEQCVKNFEKGGAKTFHQTTDGGIIFAGNNVSGFWLKKMAKEGATPFILFTPGYPGVHQQITFNASLSCDPGNNITMYQWDFGDNNITNTTGNTITHSYASSGIFNVNLTTKNIDSVIGSTTMDMTVQKMIPPSEQWNLTFGGSDEDSANCVRQTFDGGYILAGLTSSNGSGLLLLKTDEKGNKLWKRTYVGPYSQTWADSIQQTTDGGYIIVSSKYELINSAPSKKICLLKVDSLGEEQWNQTYVETGYSEAFSVLQTQDDGYFITGITPDTYETDLLLIKTDSNGNQQWQKVIKWDGDAFSALQTTDGSFIIAGTTRRHELESTSDILLIKLDLYGNEQWNRIISEAGCLLKATCIQETSDGGYIIAGTRWLYGKEKSDFLLIKTDFEGNIQWNKTFGGTEHERSYSVAQTTDGGFIIAGETWSYGAGKNDLWLVKTDPQGNMLWHNCFGGPHYDKASFVQETFDNGYIIAGLMDSACGCYGFNFCVIKLKADPIEPDEVSTSLESIPTQPDEVSTRLESIPTQPSYIPGFGVVFSIGNLLVVTCLMLKIKRKQGDINSIATNR
ncbi:MAG: PKD domain-containing protein [Methanosarcinaceae archaeon]|nr:PKD domain-containing protein [Methanosarcinaceae archaeon]